MFPTRIELIKRSVWILWWLTLITFIVIGSYLCAEQNKFVSSDGFHLQRSICLYWSFLFSLFALIDAPSIQERNIFFNKGSWWLVLSSIFTIGLFF